ncbi:hypothetical protein PYW08_004817 [Mythimna loreyi]|uniref:Uncharacterized protein n=1 Tax=Mythimna loreyi TaxID=667449 RepID=A0ACC2QEF0_9NEOP|nr:hypothetical protein PYW08_004817 [Mythimna loreyi]
MATRYTRGDERMNMMAPSSKNTETVSPPELYCCKMSVTITLKHQKSAPGLVELIDHSGVYLNADKLADCKTMSDDPINMARMLVGEIFTTIPLSACLVTNTGVRAIDYHERRVEHARNIILKFVTERAWFDCNILKGIDLKMHEIKVTGQRKLNDESSKEKLVVYDKNDLRWTLKYHEPAPGLVELIEQTRVYVNADKLSDCKTLSKDMTTFIPMLLHEVFVMCALTKCYGGRRHCYYIDPDSIALDKHAVATVVKFVEEYAQQKGWQFEYNRSTRQICRYLDKIRSYPRDDRISRVRRRDRLSRYWVDDRLTDFGFSLY